PQRGQGGGADTVGAVIALWAGDATDAVKPARAADAGDAADAPAAPDAVDDAPRSRGAKRRTFSGARADVPEAAWLSLSAAHWLIGGAMPYARSFSRASAPIQSVVHAGASTVSIRYGVKCAASSALPMSSAICHIAGQPE